MRATYGDRLRDHELRRPAGRPHLPGARTSPATSARRSRRRRSRSRAARSSRCCRSATSSSRSSQRRRAEGHLENGVSRMPAVDGTLPAGVRPLLHLRHRGGCRQPCTAVRQAADGTAPGGGRPDGGARTRSPRTTSWPRAATDTRRLRSRPDPGRHGPGLRRLHHGTLAAQPDDPGSDHLHDERRRRLPRGDSLATNRDLRRPGEPRVRRPPGVRSDAAESSTSATSPRSGWAMRSFSRLQEPCERLRLPYDLYNAPDPPPTSLRVPPCSVTAARRGWAQRYLEIRDQLGERRFERVGDPVCGWDRRGVPAALELAEVLGAMRGIRRATSSSVSPRSDRCRPHCAGMWATPLRQFGAGTIGRSVGSGQRDSGSHPSDAGSSAGGGSPGMVNFRL